jgi:outer membrane biosynthesis protein TonB
MNGPPPEHRFTTRAQDAFRRGGTRRLLAAVGVAAVALLLLVLLGPDQDAVKRRFEYYGAPDELHIMPEISIEEGQDAVRQLPQSLQQPPPPAQIEVEPEEVTERADDSVPVPVDSEAEESQPVPVVDPAEVDETERVELSLPMQSNPDWYILEEVRPDYPVDVSESERRTPVIFVRAAIFVGPDGLVQERMVLATNGTPAFGNAVLEALAKWRFGWRVAPGAGRWIEMTWNFRSPYFTPER